ncbi:MAG: hypothetical protein CMF59_13895 [Leptospiraceae bacterium]|nr:hypothetical protein [Leptospiraceae bacterium]
MKKTQGKRVNTRTVFLQGVPKNYEICFILFRTRLNWFASVPGIRSSGKARMNRAQPDTTGASKPQYFAKGKNRMGRQKKKERLIPHAIQYK